MAQVSYVMIEPESDPDFSYLEQECFAGEDARDHVQFTMIAYDEDGKVTDSLSCIDFLEAGDQYTTGRFDSVSDIPARCDYLREVARGMGLPEDDGWEKENIEQLWYADSFE
jgi:hypothetical protein